MNLSAQMFTSLSELNRIATSSFILFIYIIFKVLKMYPKQILAFLFYKKIGPEKQCYIHLTVIAEGQAFEKVFVYRIMWEILDSTQSTNKYCMSFSELEAIIKI